MAIMTPSKRFFVYTLDRPVLNGIPGKSFYVGKGTGKRPEKHLNEARGLDCYCRKCRVIRLIWAMGKEVVITYHFETNNEREAYAYESKLTQELSIDGSLCNKANNREPFNAPLIPFNEMTYGDYVRHVKSLDMSRKDRETAIYTWIHRKRNSLERMQKSYRLRGQRQKAQELQAEIDELLFQTGFAEQDMLFDIYDI